MLLRADEVIPLAPKVFDTLLVLLENRGRVMEKQELIGLVWEGVAVEEVGLAKNISALRKSLGESPSHHQYIVTVPGRGYRFVADVWAVSQEVDRARPIVDAPRAVSTVAVSAVSEETVSEPPLASEALIPKSRDARFHWRLKVGLFLMALAALGGGLYLRSHPARAGADTILLADFVNQTGDPVFDLTLRRGLAVQLEQSPMLNIYPDERIRATVRLMRGAPDERITQVVGLEVCRRQGLKALVAGLIAPFGSHYAITLEAIDAQSGDTLGRVQEEAAAKEDVLGAMSKAAAALRSELGESLPSIRKFDALLENTTNSLEALQAYSLGHQERMRGRHREAIPFYRRACELDPAFAYAYAGLATIYSNMEQPLKAAEYATKAYELRDHASEMEKFAIESFYYGFVTGELGKRLEVLNLEQRTYPWHATAYTNMASTYASLGQFEQSAEQSRLAIRLSPDSEVPHALLGRALIHLNRFAEARRVYGAALGKKMDSPSLRYGLFQIAFVDGDAAAMNRQIAWAAGKGSMYRALDWQAAVAAYRGQAQNSASFAHRSSSVGGEVAPEVASEYGAQEALRQAALGQCDTAKAEASEALADRANQLSLTRAALALAWCDAADVKPLTRELARRYPLNTLVNWIWLPEIEAATELRRGRAESAVESLAPVRPYEAAGEFWPQYIRGQAYLYLEKGSEAAAEFKKILAGRGQDTLSPLYPLSQYGLARALALQREVAEAHSHYGQFLAEWRGADSDLPALVNARRDTKTGDLR